MPPAPPQLVSMTQRSITSFFQPPPAPPQRGRPKKFVNRGRPRLRTADSLACPLPPKPNAVAASPAMPVNASPVDEVRVPEQPAATGAAGAAAINRGRPRLRTADSLACPLPPKPNAVAASPAMPVNASPVDEVRVPEQPAATGAAGAAATPGPSKAQRKTSKAQRTKWWEGDKYNDRRSEPTRPPLSVLVLWPQGPEVE